MALQVHLDVFNLCRATMYGSIYRRSCWKGLPSCISHSLLQAREWLPELVERAKKLKVSEGMVAGADVGPLITCGSKERVESLIQSGVDEGAQLLLDGRGKYFNF